MDSRQLRQAANEMFFRSLNESIESLAEDVFPSPDERGTRPYDFVCECHNPACTERIPMTIAEYEHVRSDDRHFLVAPAEEHVVHSVEIVIERSSRYWIVEKRGEAGRLAEADDEARGS